MGWPLFALFGGFPLWWVLGIGDLSGLIFAVPMLLHLRRMKVVLAPRGFGTWLLFLVWALGGVLVLQVHAPGSIAAHSMSRYFTFGYRLLWYVAATVVLLYIVNTWRQLSDRKVAMAFSYMFVVVSLGGLLGVLAPHLEFRSVLEHLLPHRLSSNGFVRDIVHPTTAQVQKFLGYEEARPSAPFAFTNEWGLAVACFLPYFVITWCAKDAGWRRVAAPFVLLIATVAVVFSLNRGLWLALTAAGLYVAIRYALLGHFRVLVALFAAVAGAFTVVAFSPLGALVLDRFAHPNSNEGRTNLGTLTTSSVLQGSPLLGFGSTRNVLGNFQSIASAASATCPGCSPPPLGTQGHLWLVLFSTGVVGLVLYLGFFVSQLLRHITTASPYSIAACSVILMHLVTMPVYDSISPSLFAIFGAIGLLWRADRRDRRATIPGVAGPRSPSVTVGEFFRLVRRHAVALVVATLIGAALGAAFQLGRPATFTASESVLLPSDRSTSSNEPPVTIDTDAQLVTSDPVLKAVSAATGGTSTHAQVAARLDVTAIPNTRILHIAYTAASPDQALRGVQAATREFLGLRDQLTGLSLEQTDPGEIVRVATVHQSRDAWVVAVSSGAMLGLLLSLLYWRLVGDAAARIRNPRGLALVSGLPVVAVVDGRRGRDRTRDLASLAGELSRRPVRSMVAVSSSPAARLVVSDLEPLLAGDRARSQPGSVIVVSSRTRAAEVSRLRDSMQRTGQHLIGTVLVEES